MGWRMLCYALFQQRFWSILAAGIMLLALHYGHFAGEWLIGGVEAKGLAYGFLFAGAGCLIQGRWHRVWILLGLSAAFHVLVGGWGVIAAGMAWIFCGGWKTSWKSQLLSGSVGFAISLLGLLPALLLTLGQDPAVIRQANEIYTFERIAHHLVFSHIVQQTPARLDLFVTLCLIWLTLVWVNWDHQSYRRLNSLILGTLLIASCALFIEYVAKSTGDRDLAAKLLRFYWFRLSDVFVPMGIGIGFTLGCKTMLQLKYDVGAVLISVLVCLIVSHVVWISIEHAISKRSHADKLTLISFGDHHQLNRKILRDWVDVCAWIRHRTDPTSRFLTPRQQSTFKWYAQRSEVVSWKDVPQDAVGIVNWKNRFAEVFAGSTFRFGMASLDAEDRLLKLGEKYDAQYVLIERRHVRERKAELQFRYNYRQYLLGKPVGQTPFEKPLCLKQVYPDSTCSPEIRRESTYLVYALEIPPAYQTQIQEIKSLLDWFQQFELWMQAQAEPQSGR